MRISDSGTSVRWIDIDEGSEGQRVDNFLLKTLKGVPKSRIYRCVRKGEVRVNGRRVKVNTRLNLSDRVRIPPLRMSDETPVFVAGRMAQRIEDAIIHEDDRLLVINKPAGIAVHGGSGVSAGVIETLRAARPDARYLELVHRLDRETSGCLMISKKPKYLKELQRLLGVKTEIVKHYVAVVHGRWPRRRKVVELPLRKNTLSSGERISVVAADGKASRTDVEVLDYADGISLLALRPVTGRTHQLRVHCRHLEHPIVGDPKYGYGDSDRELPGTHRMMLHAARLELPALLDGPSLDIRAKFDGEFQKALEPFKNNNLVE